MFDAMQKATKARNIWARSKRKFGAHVEFMVISIAGEIVKAFSQSPIEKAVFV